MKQIKYSIYRPAGNDTALVYGTNYTKKIKKKINDAIMKKHTTVEQVGFINNNGKKELQMAGGEFCGNATRSAAYDYLNGMQGKIQICVNSKDKIIAGVDKDKKAWCEIPLYENRNIITEKENGVFIVEMKGITIVVIQEFKAKKYLCNRDKLKQIGRNLINNYNLVNNSAVGVIFCEKKKEKIKINPVVWVKNIDTLFYETACGSGSIAVCIIESYLKRQSQKIDILQPSDLIITANVDYKNNKFEQAVISGNIENDGIIYSLNL